MARRASGRALLGVGALLGARASGARCAHAKQAWLKRLSFSCAVRPKALGKAAPSSPNAARLKISFSPA